MKEHGNTALASKLLSDLPRTDLANNRRTQKVVPKIQESEN
jgi:hypothetical protein